MGRNIRARVLTWEGWQGGAELGVRLWAGGKSMRLEFQPGPDEERLRNYWLGFIS